MADKNSGWLCNATASVVSETNTTATIRVTSYWKSNGWRYDINHVSSWVYKDGTNYQVMNSGSVNTTSDLYGSVNLGYHDFVVNKTTSVQSIPCCAKITSNSTYVSGTKWSGDIYVTVKAKPSYTVTYNANGGSGAPGNQTKWYGTNLTLSSSKPSRTGHNFVRWNTNTSNTGTAYNPGATYSGNSNLTLDAILSAHTYTVTYNANGGSGAPGNQTKTYGVNLSLSTTKPTRTNYNFKGWSTSANGGVVYSPGSTYSSNSAVTLYAVWELAYQRPRITNFKAQRCTSNGTASETGTYLKVTFNWATDKTVTAIWIDWTISTDKNWANYSNAQVTASGTSGSVSQVVGGGNVSTESSYLVRCYVDDGTGNTHSGIASIGTVKFPIDVKKGGTGVAIGKVAETENLFDVGLPTKLAGGVKGDIEIIDHGAKIHWKEYGFGDQFAILANFNNVDDSNKLKIMGAVGDAGTTPDLYDLLTITGKSGNVWIKGSLSIQTYARNTTDTWIPVITSGRLDYTERRFATGVTHTNFGTNNDHIPTMSFLSHWNGAYNGNNTSNLTYCHQGTIQAKPVVAYLNSSGTSGTITLSYNPANYTHIKITYVNNDNQYGSTSVAATGNLGSFTTYGTIVRKSSSDNAIMLNSALFNISGTTLTIARNTQGNIYFGGTEDKSDSNALRVVKVDLWN